MLCKPANEVEEKRGIRPARTGTGKLLVHYQECTRTAQQLWLSLVGLGRSEVTPVEQALVGDRSPNGLPKKPPCVEAGSSTSYG